MIPVVAIVGRPNVGKSTLFNRLIGQKHAVISNIPGTTRDLIYKMSSINDIETMIVDTGGIELETEGDMEANVQRQAKTAIVEADVIVFVIDGSQFMTANDFEAAEILRKSGKPIMLIASKADNSKIEENVYNLYELGFGEPIRISAIHNRGIDILEDRIGNELKKKGFKKTPVSKKLNEQIPQIALVGKPNVGKSSIVNALFGKEKVIVSEKPGTTRDAIDTLVTYKSKKYNLIDTAGLRRRGKIERGIEKFSVLRSLQSIHRCDIAVLVMDASEPVGKQDCHVSQHILEAGKGLIIVLNKSDLLDKEEQDKKLAEIQRKMPYVPWAPVILASASKKKNLETILELTDEIVKEQSRRIQTAEFNLFLEKIMTKHPPTGGRNPKIYYGSQVAVNPPEFVFFVNNRDNFHFSYLRYLENEIRKQYGFNGTSMKLLMRNKN